MLEEIIHFPLHSFVNTESPPCAQTVEMNESSFPSLSLSKRYPFYIHSVCLCPPLSPSASLTHRPILLPAGFTLGLSRKAFPGSGETLMKPAQGCPLEASLWNEPRAETIPGLEYWRKHSVMERGGRGLQWKSSQIPHFLFQVPPLLPQQDSVLNHHHHYHPRVRVQPPP